MSRSPLPELPCLCAGVRRAARALTQLYDEALRPLGLRVTQFTILQVLSRAGELSQSGLAERLAMDLTTLTRTLEIMRRHGWVAERRGDDRRWRYWRLAKPGQARVQLAEPAWQAVQSRLRRRLGNENWDDFLQLANRVAGVLESEGDPP